MNAGRPATTATVTIRPRIGPISTYSSSHPIQRLGRFQEILDDPFITTVTLKPFKVGAGEFVFLTVESDDGGDTAIIIDNIEIFDVTSVDVNTVLYATPTSTSDIKTVLEAAGSILHTLNALTEASGDGDLAAALTAIGTVLDDTDELQTNQGDWATATSVTVSDKTGFSLSPTGVTAIWAKAMSDLATGAPSATASVLTAINWLYEAWRNKITTTSTTMTLHKDDGSTALTKSTISDDKTTFTKGEMVSGS